MQKSDMKNPSDVGSLRTLAGVVNNLKCEGEK